MIKKTALALCALFASAVAHAQDPAAEIARLQSLYDDVNVNNRTGTLSRIHFLPRGEDEVTFKALGINEATPEKRTAALMARIADDIYEIKTPLKDIEENILGDMPPVSKPDHTDPVNMTALMIGPHGSDLACFSVIPRAYPELKKEILAFNGLDGYVGFNGIAYDGSNIDNPYEYTFDIPITAAAWQNFKTHYAAASCLLDARNNPNFTTNDDKERNTVANAAVGFAAVMAARDGFPEILPFLGNYLSATIHNPGAYSTNYVYAHIIDDKSLTPGQMGTHVREAQNGGHGLGYPVALIDNLTRMWNAPGNRLAAIPTSDLYPAIRALAAVTAFDEKQSWTFAGIGMKHYEPAPADLDAPLRKKLLARAQQGAAALNVCVTYSKTWEAQGKAEGKDYWAERRQDIWAPPVCK